MAKIKYNVKGVDRGGKDFEQPQPGLYEMEIMEATPRTEGGKNDIELVLEVTKNNDAFVGSRVWTYVGLGEASQWKLAELTDALGLPEQGTLDTDKLKGKKLKVKINSDSYNNEYRARAGRFAPLSATAEEDGDPDPEDPDAEPSGEDEPILIERNDVELSTDPEYYGDWTDEDLKEEIDNQKLDVKGRFSRKKVIEALVEVVRAEAGGGGGDGNDDPEPAAGEDGDEYDDADTWSDKDLAAEYKKRGLDTIKGKKDRAKVIAALREDDANEDDPFAD